MAEKYEHTKSLGTVANVGLGYRQLSKNEHAYVGVNGPSLIAPFPRMLIELVGA